VKAARHVVRAAGKAGILDRITEGDDGIVGNDAEREIRLDRMSRRFGVLVGIVDGREDTVDRRAFPAGLLVFPASALTFRSMVLVLLSTSLALPSTVHAVPADRPAVQATASALPARLRV
jgi:hypothetical protein